MKQCPGSSSEGWCFPSLPGEKGRFLILALFFLLVGFPTVDSRASKREYMYFFQARAKAYFDQLTSLFYQDIQRCFFSLPALRPIPNLIAKAAPKAPRATLFRTEGSRLSLLLMLLIPIICKRERATQYSYKTNSSPFRRYLNLSRAPKGL